MHSRPRFSTANDVSVLFNITTRAITYILARMAKKFYAVRKGVTPGVYTTWSECERNVKGFKGATYKSFATLEEAQSFVNSGRGAVQTTSKPQPSSSTTNGNRRQPSPSSSSTMTGDSPAIGADREGELWIPMYCRTPKSASYQEAVRIPVYTDGCARGNGGVGAYAGIGVFYGPNDTRNVAEPIYGTKQTNQVAEITAIIKALDLAQLEAEKYGKGIEIITDSKYAIQCFTTWAETWIKNGWMNSLKKPVENGILINNGLSVIQAIEDSLNKNNRWRGVVFRHVRGHNGIFGNEQADRLANMGAEKNPLYK